MSVLITGGNGQLGRALREYFPDGIYTDSADLDITSPEQLASYDWTSVDTIINAAAYTNVDGAQTDEGKALAFAVNDFGVRNLASVANSHNITLVHISTEYVFDGSREVHDEQETPNPLSEYGRSKLAGDLAVQTANKYYILRTSWVVGDGKNFVRTMLELGKKGVSPAVVADQIGRPTFASELARAIKFMLEQKPEYGLYDISNDGEPISWFGLTQEIFRIAGFAQEVKATSTAQYFADKPLAAKRPLNSTFSLAKIKLAGFTPNDWRSDLIAYIDKELS